MTQSLITGKKPEISPKEMILTTLEQSKKPLMAKKIAFNIYRKFEGYRMSRFVVRDILWKELKDQIDYNPDDYTYTLKDKKAFDKTSKITEQIEIKFEDNKKIDDDNLNPLYYPFIFNIPDKNMLREEINDWWEKINQIGQIIGVDHQKISYSFNAIEENIENENDWCFIFEAIRQYKTLNGSLKNTSNYNQLKENLSNPFHYLLIQLDLQLEKNKVRFNDEQFQKIFDEAARDNKISAKEEKYLFEKALELNICKSELTNAIETIDFKAYKSFKLLVDEICEDGLITPAEQDYIEEKARDYNVGEDQLNRMLKSVLFKVKLLKKYKNNPAFFEYVNLIFLFRAFGLEIDNEIYVYAAKNERDFLQYIETEKKIMFQELLNKIENKLQIIPMAESVNELSSLLGIIPTSLNKAIENQIRSAGEIKKPKPLLSKKYKIDGYDYEIKWIDVKNKPLFFEDYINSTNIITLNASHWILKDKSSSEKEILEKIFISLISAKSEFTHSSIESFLNKLNGKMDLLKFEY